ncbi:DUF3592 domain-containing protein [Roseovarius sp. 2305UL8-3]|uniref:DUF3592 domain-containing protein n=1 Tax=Roseovarius conchicola TaxID=3121636 RepID=UPI0035278CCB
MSLEIPRYPVPIWRLFLKMGGWIVLISGAILLLFTLISHLALQTAKQFEREGRMASAMVTEKYTTESRDSDGDRTTTYWLTFDFVTERREEVTVTESVGTSAYRRAEVGQPFELLYLASNPQKIEATPGSNRRGSRVFQIMALVLGLIWLVGLWKVGGWSVSAVRARRFGTRETAKVKEVRRTAVRINNRPRYRLIWRDSKGREGASLLRKGADLESFGKGDPIEIYMGLKTSWWVGDIGERPEFAQ